jgi:DNA/RNA-binding domain of Phe-tRNA-synthetase-like protein
MQGSIAVVAGLAGPAHGRHNRPRMELCIEPHPLLRLGAFTSEFLRPLGELSVPAWLGALLALEADTPLRRDEDTRTRIRDLLRHDGYKPTGRGKPSSEYLLRAVGEGALGSINLAVDACNAVSLASALPISVIDLERATPPFSVAVAPQGASYVFNAGGQEIDLSGLLCLCDAEGPCANPVKDSQRTKTSAATRRTLSVVWACTGLEERLARTLGWYRQLLERAGAATEAVGAP